MLDFPVSKRRTFLAAIHFVLVYPFAIEFFLYGRGDENCRCLCWAIASKPQPCLRASCFLPPVPRLLRRRRKVRRRPPRRRPPAHPLLARPPSGRCTNQRTRGPLT